MTCGDERFRHAAGPYLLGALDAAERMAFDEHLKGCARCRAEVAELRPVVTMLGAVSEDDVAALVPVGSASGRTDPTGAGDAGTGDTGAGDVDAENAAAHPAVDAGRGAADATDPPVPETLLPGLLVKAARLQRRRRTVLGGLGGVAAAAIIALAVVLIAGFTRPSTAPTAGGQVMVMQSVGGEQVHATATVTGMPWGTEITLHCQYQGGGKPGAEPGGGAWGSGSPVYTLKVMDTKGSMHDMGSWTVSSGQDAVFTGGTSVPRSQIGRIEVVDSNGATVLTAAG